MTTPKPKGKRGPAKGQGGRPKGEDRRKITAHVKEATWEAIDAVMMEQGCSTGQAIDILLAEKA